MTLPGISAGAATPRQVFVKISASFQVIPCVANDIAIGVSGLGTRDAPLPGANTNAANAAGDPLRVFGMGECAPMLAGAPITAGQYLKPDANGNPVPAGPGEAYSAQAMESQSTVGGSVLVYIVRGLVSFPTVAGTVQQALRRRCTIAEINAGLTLLPAIAGQKYRINDVAMIAIGGNAAGATSVDLNGTQSTPVKLLAAAVAGLTQSTLLRAGATNAAILADGASFAQNDVNTAIAIGKTGGALSGCTAVDVIIDYTVEL